MTKRLQTYQNDAITVTFDPNLCIHSAVCLRGLPAVFDVRRKRWIDVDAGAAEAVAETVRACPSGALQHHMQGKDSMPPTPDTTPATDVRIAFIPNGPIRVSGSVTVVTEDGTEVRDQRVFLCRCGGSARKPYCDGTHKRNGFRSTD